VGEIVTGVSNGGYSNGTVKSGFKRLKINRRQLSLDNSDVRLLHKLMPGGIVRGQKLIGRRVILFRRDRQCRSAEIIF